MYLSDGNSKYAKSKLKVLTWGIPAFKSVTGLVTCPGAGWCARLCYAQQGRMRMANCRQAQERRLALSLAPGFVESIVRELKARKWARVRVHDTGDFYNPAYLGHWFEIINQFPDKSFFAYTKMVPMFKALPGWPPNLHVVYSLGGKWDDQVDLDKDFHSRIFEDAAAATAAGYAVSPNEFPLSMDRPVTREALLYHGNRNWSTCLGTKP